MKKVVYYILFLGIAALLLYLSFREIKWRDFWYHVQAANYGWIALSMVCGAVAFWIRAMRWRLLIQGAGHEVSRGSAFDAVNIAYITNFAFPRAGEVARCGVLAKKGGVPFDTLLGTVVLERIFDTFCLMVITALVIALQWSVFGVFMEQQLWNPMMATLNEKTVYLVVILLALSALFALLLVYRKRLQKIVIVKKIVDLAIGIFNGLKSGFTMRQKTPFLGYTLVLWFLYWATCWCTIMAFPTVAYLNPLDAVFLMVVGSLGWVVPAQGGIGAYHFILSLALTSVYGISQTQGLVFATISHGSQAITMILFGLFSILRLFTRSKPNQIGKDGKKVV